MCNGVEEQEGRPTLELYRTDRADLEMASNYALPFIDKQREEVRIRVRH
jgi:hypothetical protein